MTIPIHQLDVKATASSNSPVPVTLLQALVPLFGLYCIILYLISIPVFYVDVRDNCVDDVCVGFYNPPPGTEWLVSHGFTAGQYAGAYTAIYVVYGLLHIIAGLVIYFKNRSEPMAKIGSLTLIALGVMFTPISKGFLDYSSAMKPFLSISEIIGFASFMLFLFTFPDGRFMPRWSMKVFYIALALWVPKNLFPGTVLDIGHWSNLLNFISPLFWMVSIVGVTIFRYRKVMKPLERQQTKWVIYGVVIALGGLTLFTVLFLFQGEKIEANYVLLYATEVAIHASMAAIPVTILMAVLRRRLWDIDPIMNRTIVYSILSLCVVLLYVISVWYLGALLRNDGQWFVSLLATSIVAVAFAPMKERLQRLVNKMMYGEQDSPHTVLSRLGDRLQDPLQPEAAMELVARTVRESLRLPYSAIVLDNGAGVRMLAAESGVRQLETVPFPLIHRGEEIGELRVAPRAAGETFTASDRRFLTLLVNQSGAVVQGAKASSDLRKLADHLRASKEKLIYAREEERLRLRRNLHDDLAPRLAALALTAYAAEELVTSDVAKTKSILSELGEIIRQTVSEIRGMVHNLRPPALDELGLEGAIRERINDVTIPINSIEEPEQLKIELEVIDSLPNMPAAVEVAAYRIATEAIVNVVRHAGATRCFVRLGIVELDSMNHLHVEISDNGTGIRKRREEPKVEQPGSVEQKRETGGIGLGSMRERAEELGGVFRIDNAVPQGTIIHAYLPLTSAKNGGI